MGLIMDSTRPMDNMALVWTLGGRGRREPAQLRGVSVRPSAVHDGRVGNFTASTIATPEDVRWRDSSYFLKKIQFAAGGAHRRLLLKSPVHTARVKLLREMFPKAAFMVVHRHQSSFVQGGHHG